MSDITEAREEDEPFKIEEAGGEDESDLGPEPLGDFEKAVVTSTDWTTETILNQLSRGNIDLNPDFQRRDAWAKSNRKSLFIESIFLGLPIPQLVLAERKGERGSFIVIDGKQRLLALRQFAAADGSFSPLVLTDLEVRSDLDGKTLEDLRADGRFARDVRAFDNETIRTIIVRSWPSEEFLYRVFLRLNTGTQPLSAQELRQALHPGPFVRFADAFSLNSEQVRRALRLRQPDFRMRDVEIVVRFFAFERFLGDYRGDLKAFLDMTCERLNAAWGEAEHGIMRSARSLEAAIDATFEIFGRWAFRRWNGENYEASFNRAVFDVMTYYFRRPKVAKAAVARRDAVRRAFERLTVDEPDFAQSLIATTKTMAATNLRIDRWGSALSEAIGVDLSPYQLGGFDQP